MSEDLVLLELNARWNCDLPFGWVPIIGPADNSEELEIYDLEAFLEWFDAETIKLLLADIFDIATAYEIVEGGAVSFVDLGKCVFGYNGLEHMYTDAAFQFLLYFSHEDSVTAGGKELIEAIHRAWPAYKSHFWTPASWL
ncbi:hypothetical protein [Hymenobacter negativus]|uniref:Uncharacterized protein n=1 Tax=Hymenobacter negativus TaxID=2795026 RepID=A0ABS3Q9T0_9BACT|nr:hypothetical protein [Hymenobacter negativus]MBO2007995.1 hypothetical protein [Hymenobacter negativus]